MWEKEKNQYFDLFPQCFLPIEEQMPIIVYVSPQLKIMGFSLFNPLPKKTQQILDSSKLKEFADNFKSDENSRKFSRKVENTARKKDIAC